MDYEQVVRDFAHRTVRNLELVEDVAASGQEAFEITQLVNSTLGLLVFPKEEYYDAIPRKALQDLRDDGWPVPAAVGELPDANDLQQLMRYMRNAVAHYNVQFLADTKGELNGFRLWNEREGKKTWEAEVSTADLRDLLMRFIDVLVPVE